ncbi:DNA-binding protein [Candidatus Bathyarchaeota archaeon]|nr:DNA-binding protein [Candidatus Bathyarchaeota archaeon]
MPESEKRKIRVILDSNAFFIPIQFNIDIFEELSRILKRNFEPILLPQVKKELETMLEKGSPKTRKEAAFALKIAEKCKLVEEEINGSTDDAILELARRWRTPVFTNDKALRKRLRDINVPVIYLRQKARLEIDGGYELV